MNNRFISAAIVLLSALVLSACGPKADDAKVESTMQQEAADATSDGEEQDEEEDGERGAGSIRHD